MDVRGNGQAAILLVLVFSIIYIFSGPKAIPQQEGS